MATFDVSLVTPDGLVFEGEAEMLIVPGADGEIGVLARHAPLVAMLKAGSTRVHVRRDDDVREFATGPGFLKVEQDRALALVDDAGDARPRPWAHDARGRRRAGRARPRAARLRPAGGRARPPGRRDAALAGHLPPRGRGQRGPLDGRPDALPRHKHLLPGAERGHGR